MNKTVKTILITALISVLVICSGIFGIYKYFVTPNRILMLSIINMRSDLTRSFNYISDDEMDMISEIAEDGGKLEFNGEIEKLSELTNVPLSLTVNSDKKCSVTSLKLYDEFGIDIYKDKTQMLINTPLFSGGGFSIPIADFKTAWSNSIFKDIWTVSTRYSLSDILWDFVKGNINIKSFYSSKSDVIMPVIKEIEVKKDGSSNVMVGSSTKKAKRYTAHISEENMDTLISCFKEYFYSTAYGKDKVSGFAEIYGITEQDALNKIFEDISSSFNDFDITFKICDSKIREIFIELADGNNITVAFSGEKNVFDTISYYKNNDVESAVKRVKSTSQNTVSDIISSAGNNIAVLNDTPSGFEFTFDNDYFTAYINASGKNENDEHISFDNVNINLNNLFVIKGSCLISEEYDSDFSFTKKGEYVNLLEINQTDWETISGSILNTLNIIK